MKKLHRREFLKLSAASSVLLYSGTSSSSNMAQSSNSDLQFAKSPARYPDPNVIKLDRRFTYSLGNAAIERLYTGTRWAEGPAWNNVGRYLIWSDIPRNEQLRLTDENGAVSRNFRQPSGFSNGNTFDFCGRQVSCQHQYKRVVRYEHNGTVSILADSFNGKSLNAPNDVVVNRLDGSIWFTDPGYGSLSWYEGTMAESDSPQPYQKEAVYRIDANNGTVTKVTEDVAKPNGLCFSPDFKKLYVSDTGRSHYQNAKSVIKVWDIDDNRLKNGRDFCSMTMDGSTGVADGIKADIHGNIWASAGWAGAGYDGVHIFAPNGDRIGLILLPEICSNLCFGGQKGNRLFMTASQSLYSLYVNTQGANFV